MSCLAQSAWVINAVAMSFIPSIQSYRLSSRLTILTDGFQAQPNQMSYPLIQGVVQQAGKIILGKERQIRLALACLLARGHLLIEDLPGVGKTTLAQVLAKLLGLNFHRIQFTSDMLPADIIGVSVYERENSIFRFHAGPIFSQLILADEVNRATPRTQSALLEAMEEHQVTTEGETRRLPEPFFVVATQNPSHLVGPFPRAALALLHASRAWALIEGRDKVVPEDVQAVLPGVAGHRLRPVHDGVRVSSVDKANGLIAAVPIP